MFKDVANECCKPLCFLIDCCRGMQGIGILVVYLGMGAARDVSSGEGNELLNNPRGRAEGYSEAPPGISGDGPPGYDA